MIEDRFLARLEQLIAGGQRRILGLVGAPGAGKSTLAEQILEAFPGRAVVVPMDGFHLANVELERLGRASRKGAEDTFDSAGYVALLNRLRAQRHGETVYAPAFRREIEEPIAGAIPVSPDVPLVITEGNYLLLEHGHWGLFVHFSTRRGMSMSIPSCVGNGLSPATSCSDAMKTPRETGSNKPTSPTQC
jgi:pantothenate kinase